MRSESEIQDRLERIEESLENSSGHDMSHLITPIVDLRDLYNLRLLLIGQRNILLWVLDEDETGGGTDHWTGQTGGRQR